ncbi:sulfotransferase family 2 domain-containing protein [Thalassobacter sp. 16PALIMAR09]|uniref:sulfotransferase family 2 domain-containing protein n=1 Tax=Thalassobacter sp. 16PALIMAR09 TaxID=1225651 RepID=UPI000A0133B0|nr:sulfotransferase family 2 domain-containing protein [Thalassobacter sp. 16PALIMAR09]
MIYTKHRTIFIHIPKTGGSSIGRALKPHRDLKTVLIRRANKTLKSMRLSYRVNSINEGGHPSAIEHREVLGDEYFNYFSFSIVSNPFDWTLSYYNYFHRRNTPEPLSFQEYLKVMPPKPQSEYILDARGNIMVSYVGRFETINEDFRAISRKMHLNAELPHVNSIKNLNLNTGHNKETRKLVQEKYQLDFKIFNYSMDLYI